jgi:conjugal transfer/type IV secretion protein DotA/TraY
LEFSDLFNLASDDYAVDLLHQVFGGVIEYVSGEGGDLNDGTLLTSLIALFNKACLLVALLVGTYTTYVLVFDTAADGQAFGNSADTKYTIVRILLGAIAFVPLTGGLTVAQLTLAWLMVQGSALGDVGWRLVADGSLRAEPVLVSSEPITETDFVIRRQFSNALFALTNGELCRLEMNRLSDLSNNPSSAVDREDDLNVDTILRSGFINSTAYENRSRLIYYSDVGGSYGEADNLCGSVFYEAEYVSAGVNGSGDFATRVGAAVLLNRFNSTESAIYGDILPAASDIASKVFNGERNRTEIEILMADSVNDAFGTYMSGVSSGGLDDGDFDDLHQALLDEVDDLGWPFALSWHRGITMAAQATSSSAAQLEITSNPENSLDSYFSGLGALLSGRSSGVNRGMFAKPVDDFGYLSQFSGYIAELGTYQPNAVSVVTSSGGSDKGKLLRAVYQSILEMFNSTDGGMTAVYLDPMADIINIGEGVTMVGGGVMAAGVAVEGAGWVFGGVGVGQITSAISEHLFYPIGWTLIVAGFFMISIIPAIPLVYFFSAVLSWLALCIESMFAIPLAVLTYFAPAQSGSGLIGPWNKIILNLFGIALRPIFTIIGFVASLIIMRVGLDFLFTLFAGFLGFMTAGGSWFGIIIAVGLIFMYLMVALILVMHASSLIVELGDAAMNWIGIGMSNLGKLDIGQRTDATSRPVSSITGRAGIGGASRLAGEQRRRALKGASARQDKKLLSSE